MKYRKKATALIEAFQWSANEAEYPLWASMAFSNRTMQIVLDGYQAGNLRIKTIEGWMHAQPGDWIARGEEGEIWAIKPNIFAKTYEAADEKS